MKINNMRLNELLLNKIKEVQKQIKPQVKARMSELSANNTSYESLFHELCFCLLAANTSSAMAWKMCDNISAKEFLELPYEDLRKRLNQLRCRFYNKRSQYIVLAREFDLQKLRELSKEKKRKYLIQIKGIGMKEASHYLRNIGYNDYAILDKHVINILKEHKIIRQSKALTPKRYLAIEKKLQEYCDELKITQGELDFYLWFLKTNAVMK